MRIAIDARNLTGEQAGVARYLTNLLHEFLQTRADDEYHLYSDKPLVQVLDCEGFHYHQLRGHPLIWKQLLLPLMQLSNKYEILFVPTYSTPLIYPGKTVVTIHDLFFTRFPEWSTWKQKLRFSTIVRMSARRADYVIAVSEATKHDIIELTSIPEERIRVIHEGVDDKFTQKPDAETKRVLEEYGIPSPFILHVGSFHLRRNVEKLVDAFAVLKQEKKVPHKLVMVGGASPSKLTKFRSHIEALGMSQEVKYLGIIPDEHLVQLYNQADIFIYPSRYEGFGLPVLEAMACGTPVITSNRSSLPEVAGDAALLIDPDRTEEIAEAMAVLINDTRLKDGLIKKGLTRAKKFSWHKAASETLALFHDVAQI